jgi:CRP-like cAMP-binding protein
MGGNARPTQIAALRCETRLVYAPPISDPLQALDRLAVSARYARGQEIYAPDDPADGWYRLISGVARKCALTADGRRQIVDSLRPGDFFGLITRPKHRFAVEAVKGTVVGRYPRRRVELLADSDSRIGRRIREAASEAISRSQARMIILGRRAPRAGSAPFSSRWRSARMTRSRTTSFCRCRATTSRTTSPLPPRRSAARCRTSGRAARSGSKARTGSGTSTVPPSRRPTIGRAGTAAQLPESP